VVENKVQAAEEETQGKNTVFGFSGELAATTNKKAQQRMKKKQQKQLEEEEEQKARMI